MSGPTLESVLAEHGEQQTVCECALGAHIATIGCDCGDWDDQSETYDAHVAAAVLAWIEGRLAGGDVREAVARAIGGNDKPHWWERYEDLYRADADAALAAVRGVLGAGSSTEGGRK